MKFYPIAEKDILWFGDVIEALAMFRKPKEIKLEAVDADKNRGFDIYCDELKKEYKMILSSDEWRFAEGNGDYSLCPSYSQVIPVPVAINDTALFHASRFRVQNRFPLIANIFNGNALIRSGQPLVGLTQKRSVQDEKLIEAIKSNCNSKGEDCKRILIVDARPSTSAIANTLMGAGIERLECYEGSERVYLNLENIHTIRESHDRLSQQIKNISNTEVNPRVLWIEVEEGCAWLDHLRGILDGVRKIVELLTTEKSAAVAHILVHCSDGWDRTAQLISLAQLCLFPRYRTRAGFNKLILKDWLSSGHRFSDRNNHHFKVSYSSRISSAAVTKNPWNSIKNFFNDTNQNNLNNNNNNNNNLDSNTEECPIFLQFIEATIQLVRQFPLSFPELTDEFLLKIVDDSYEGNFNSKFFGNCEAERRSFFCFKENDANAEDDQNHDHDLEDEDVVLPKIERSKMILWPAYYKRYFR